MERPGFLNGIGNFFSWKTVTQQFSPLQIAIAETNGKLRLNETTVIKLTGGVGAKHAMFVCAPLHGIDELRHCYRTIFKAAVDNGVKLLSVARL